MASKDEIRIRKIEVAKLKLMGYSHSEIVAKTGIPSRTVSRYLRDTDDEWRQNYQQIYDEIKIQKVAELRLVKSIAHAAIRECEDTKDFGTVSRLLNNLIKTIDVELDIFGVSKNTRDDNNNYPLRRQIDELISSGIGELDMSDFIEWVTEKYHRENHQ